MNSASSMTVVSAHAPKPPRKAHVGMVHTQPANSGMSNQEELNAWMRAVATASDRQAFAALFRHFAPRIKGYLVRSGCMDALAEELTQETMVALWRRAESFDPGRARLSTWLFTIARNLHIDHLRRGATWLCTDEPGETDDQPAEREHGPDEQLLAMQLEINMQQALATLPPDQAQVLRLSYFEEHPHARIAEILGIPLGTVKSRIRLAVEQLRRRLEGFRP
jgi:RNA polymerase sigma factor (sigma-70 family)